MRDVITFGTFDLTHPGHFKLFARMREIASGGRVIVMVQDSASVRDTKDCRPVLTTAEKLFMVRSCKYVDEAHSYRWLGVKHLRRVRFDVLVLGPEHPGDARFRSMMRWCDKHQKDVVILPRTRGISTSDIKKRIIAT